MRSRTGRVIGLAGVTRDVTRRKRLELDLAESRDQMSLVLAEMADGLAVIGPDLRIRFANDQYRAMFPLSGELRVPGAFMPTVLYAALERGEQPTVTPETAKAWVARIIETYKNGGDQEVQLFDGRWLHIRATPSSNGTATTLVSDVTKAKHAETELRSMAAQLEVLATTDGLTGLLNRRAFDDSLKREVARCRRARKPISLIMFDIDKFKAFNDLYGHLAGDECIRQVAAVLKTGAQRPGDLVARYGGEELAVILPERARVRS